MGSGGEYRPTRPTPNLRRQRDELVAREKERLESDLNNYLAELLVDFNSRDVDQDRERLDQLRECLGDDVDVEGLLLGGSVAKHTAVDGISDIDALVLLDRADVQGKSPGEVLEVLRSILNDALHRRDVKSIEKGDFAVTILYADGREIQLLPAVRSGKDVKISDATGIAWKNIRPSQFARKLTKANEGTNGALVPAIKLVKAINDSLPAPKQMSGYHIEALAVDAMKGYTGPKSVSGVLERVLEHSTSRVMRPIQDVTGQSRTVDDNLGAANSAQRQNISQALASVRRRLGAATSVSDWRSILEG